MTDDTRAKLADGIAAVVRRMLAFTRFECRQSPLPDVIEWASVTVWCELGEPPPLTARQLLGLRLLVGDTDPGLCAAVVESLMESGLIEASVVEVVRQAERERIYQAIQKEKDESYRQSRERAQYIPCPVPGFD